MPRPNLSGTRDPDPETRPPDTDLPPHSLLTTHFFLFFSTIFISVVTRSATSFGIGNLASRLIRKRLPPIFQLCFKVEIDIERRVVAKGL